MSLHFHSVSSYVSLEHNSVSSLPLYMSVKCYLIECIQKTTIFYGFYFRFSRFIILSCTSPKFHKVSTHFSVLYLACEPRDHEIMPFRSSINSLAHFVTRGNIKRVLRQIKTLRQYKIIPCPESGSPQDEARVVITRA